MGRVRTLWREEEPQAQVGRGQMGQHRGQEQLLHDSGHPEGQPRGCSRPGPFCKVSGGVTGVGASGEGTAALHTPPQHGAQGRKGLRDTEGQPGSGRVAGARHRPQGSLVELVNFLKRKTKPLRKRILHIENPCVAFLKKERKTYDLNPQ